MEGPEGQLPWKLPFTLGHENAGWVLARPRRGEIRGRAVIVPGR